MAICDDGRVAGEAARAEGREVHSPCGPRCCGTLRLARWCRRRRRSPRTGFGAVAVNVAGCGSAMKGHGHLLTDDPAWSVAGRRVLREVLAASRAFGSRRAPCCAASQLTLVEPAGCELCCGSVGIDNLTQPSAAANPGCALPVHHPTTLPGRSIRGA